MGNDVGEGEWRRGFRARMRDARAAAGGGKMKPDDMAKILGIDPSTYRKYEAPMNGEGISPRATIMPPRYYPQFCRVCGVDIEWLISGPRAEAKKVSKPVKSRRKA